MKLILFGCGKTGQEAFDYYGSENVAGFCDNDILKTEYLGKPVYTVESIKELITTDEYRVIIAVRNRKAVIEICEQLRAEEIPFNLFEYESGIKGSNKEIFTQIYQNHIWGESVEVFYSGPGSHEERIIQPYISLLTDLICLNDIKTITEIGCGDFNVMKRVLSNLRSVNYTGIDVVEELVGYNNEKFGNQYIRFLNFDICEKNTIFPDAELLIIRQVLQHLDNRSIGEVLRKTAKFKYILVTENISDCPNAIHNVDKPNGSHTRLDINSGVFLEYPPFEQKGVIHLLSVPDAIGGLIRTSIIVHE